MYAERKTATIQWGHRRHARVESAVCVSVRASTLSLVLLASYCVVILHLGVSGVTLVLPSKLSMELDIIAGGHVLVDRHLTIIGNGTSSSCATSMLHSQAYIS